MSEFDTESTELSIEAPEADAAEQHQSVKDEEERTWSITRVPFEADPADAVDQERTVDLEDDDYR